MAVPDNFSNPLVRDLAWLYTSAPLLRSPLPSATGARLLSPNEGANAYGDWLQRLEQLSPTQPAGLPAREQFRRLGLYGEALLAAICSEGFAAGACDYQLVARNVQIPRSESNPTTLGELDFLLKDRGNALIHTEMAVKFYLLEPHSQKYIGPNGGDRLDVKLNRLFDHQLPLSGTPQARTALAAMGLPTDPPERALLVKGTLFKHVGEAHEGHELAWRYPPGDDYQLEINPEANWGRWLRRGEWSEFMQSLERDSLLYPLARLDWLSGPQHESPVDINGAEPGAAQKAKMFALKRQGVRGFERIMLVPDTWPN